MATHSPILKGKIAFESHYGNIYQEQWGALYSALLQKKLQSHYYDVRGHHADHAAPHYFIDKASYIASLYAHKFLTGHEANPPHILDMCAAPGGKSLALLHQCMIHNTQPINITLNEKSKNRFHRLKRNMQDFFINYYHHTAPQNIDMSLSNIDGALFGKNHKDKFDMVIVDAPCSNTQHVLQSSKEINAWNPKQIKRLATQQMGLLCAAIDACNTDGIVLYMTCSIDPEENQNLITKALKKRSVIALNIQKEMLSCETAITVLPTSYGLLILPSIEDNIGPLYMCALQKQSRSIR